MSNATKTTIGVDLGDRWSRFCELAPSGEKLEEGRVATSALAFREKFGSKESSVVVIEAGAQSGWTGRLLATLGHQVVVANPRRLALITRSRRKCDRLDAEMLARLGRSDLELLSPITPRSEQAQLDLSMLRSRDVLVRARTKLINCARSIAKGFGERLAKCSAPCFYRRVRECEIPAALRAPLDPLLESLAAIELQIRICERAIEKVAASRYPVTKRFQTTPGVGPIVSVAYAVTIGDPDRIRSSRKAPALIGIVPARSQSGDRDPQRSITKEGDATLRRLMVTAAHRVLGPFGPDSDLRRWGLAIAARGGANAKKRALVAVARKLSVILHRIWVTGENYEPFHSSQRARSAALLAAH